MYFSQNYLFDKFADLMGKAQVDKILQKKWLQNMLQIVKRRIHYVVNNLYPKINASEKRLVNKLTYYGISI